MESNRMNNKIDKKQKVEAFKTLWSLKNITVKELLETIQKNEALKWAIGFGGLWFVMREMLGLIIGYHVLKLVVRIFALVLS